MSDKKEIGTVESAEIEMEDVIAVVHADKTITLEPVKKSEFTKNQKDGD